MDNLYKRACSAFLATYRKQETLPNGQVLHGWYDYISSPEYKTVGVVITAQMLIVIKDADLEVEFDCMDMIESLLSMQNSDGGWSYRTNLLMSATEPTALSILAILLWCDSLNSRQQKAVDSGITWLLRYKNINSLWGPINKKERYAHTYFSCSVLKYLYRISKISSIIRCDEVRKAIEEGCNSLLNSFVDNDSQCGWGVTVGAEPTIFHTAYVVDTLLFIRNDYLKTHQIIKASEFLKRYYTDEVKKKNLSLFHIGDSEIYQHRTSRLSYYHSVDVYLSFALLRTQSPSVLSLEKEYVFFRDCAEQTDWRYHSFVTGWRLFDIVSFCNYYEKLYKRKGNTAVKQYKVALTFAGETRSLIADIAGILASKYGKEYILYDKYYEAEFARPQLDLYLQDLYHNHSDLIVVFICSEYAKKKWCGVEWRAIRDILNQMDYHKIMYVKATSEDISNFSLPGFYPLEDGYIDSSDHTSQEIADLIIQRYEQQN